MNAYISLVVIYFQLLLANNQCFAADKQEEELCPEEELCQSLMKQCPILNSARGRPRLEKRGTDPTMVSVEVVLIRMLELDEKEQRMAIEALFDLLWYLPECAWWNETALSRVARSLEKCTFPKDSIWHPNILLMNAYEDPHAITDTSGDIEVYNCTSCKYGIPSLKRNPFASMRSVGKYETVCVLDLKNFPFDTQECYWDFGTTEQDDELKFMAFTLELVEESKKLVGYEGMTFLTKSSIWELNNTTKNYYSDGINFYRFGIVISRQPRYYVLSIFLPLMVLLALQFVGLILPPDETDRTSFAVTVMLAFSVMQPSISSNIPVTSDPVYIFWYVEALLLVAAAITTYAAISCLWARSNKRQMIFICCKLPIIRIVDIIVALVGFIAVIATHVVYFQVVYAH